MREFQQIVIGAAAGLLMCLLIAVVFVQAFGVRVGRIEYAGGNAVGDGDGLIAPVMWSFTDEWYPLVDSASTGAGIWYAEPFDTLNDNGIRPPYIRSCFHENAPRWKR